LQTKYRLGIQFNDTTLQWEPTTQTIETYDILDRTNQYIYTIRDIVNIIRDLEANIAQIPNNTDGSVPPEKRQLQDAKNTWQGLLNKNLAYQWHLNLTSENPLSFEDFKTQHGLPDNDESETLIFSAGPAFEYSRRIAQGNTLDFATRVSLGTTSAFSSELEAFSGIDILGNGLKLEFKAGSEASIGTEQGFEKSVESGQETEQTIGFVLQDDDIGDNITTRVYTDPVWGTPLFFQDGFHLHLHSGGR